MATESPLHFPSEDLHFNPNWRSPFPDSIPKRSDSAPPVILGANNSYNNYDNDCEEQLRSNPAYLEYYNSKVNLNPRLPPPLIKREGRHLLHRIVNTNDSNNNNIINVGNNGDNEGDVQRSVLSTHNEETEDEKSPRNMDEFQGSPSPPFEDPSSTQLAPEHDTCQPPIGSFTPPQNPSPNPNNPSSSSTPSSSEKSPIMTGKSKLISDIKPKPLVVTDLATLEAEMQGLSVNFPPNQMKGLNVNFLTNPPQIFQQQPLLQQTGNINIQTPFYPPNNNINNTNNNIASFGPGLFYPPPNPNFIPNYNLPGLNPNFLPLNPNFIPLNPNYPPPQSPIASTGLSSDFLYRMGPAPPVQDPNFMQFYPIANPYNPLLNNKPVINMDPFSPGLRPVSVNPNPFRKIQAVPLNYQSVASPRRSENNSNNQNFRGEFRNSPKFEDSSAKPFSFLEELKSNRNRRFELSDIAGRIVEFSADQHGSRFIQQKLEISSPEEKAAVFNEILPHATSLMTDVFGNYVIQKFFEYGNKEQRRDLANKLVGHILPLSLQMYGCRVIQKALEVIEMEQKRELVRELEGHEMHCVRDQNGNHVIQKCIECVPAQQIAFVINAFKGQVAALSMHPYGCRVIQRVLEHCTNDPLGQCIVDEILQSACTLAQDQYGNYVTQHVLEKGKGEERSEIIKQLAGQVVIMSQNKFASNVIEKCFQHGSAKERDMLICGIIEQTEGNDNLLVMMKDQYANYVVQKILETCDSNQRDVLLNRVKNHLPALRKYTYGKHIVARVDQLLSEGNMYGA